MPRVTDVQLPSVFVTRDRVRDAAQLAAGRGGAQLDVADLPAEMQPVVEALVGSGGRVSLGLVQQRLDQALTLVDSFDVGPTGGRGVPGYELEPPEQRIADHRYAHPETAVERGLVDRLFGGRSEDSDLRLDAKELGRLERSAGSEGAMALVELAAAEGQPSQKLLAHARRFLLDADAFTSVRDESNGVDTFSGPAGSTKGLAEVRVVDRHTGAWYVGEVDRQGGFSVEVGKPLYPVLEVSYWFVPADGSAPFGGFPLRALQTPPVDPFARFRGGDEG